jgi:threonine dehydratase
MTKVSATRGHGAEVILHGTNYDEAHDEAQRPVRRRRPHLHPPFDDDAVIAGQGTIGLELIEQNPYRGGGGAIGGGGSDARASACAIKENNPSIRVIGVQTARSARR